MRVPAGKDVPYDVQQSIRELIDEISKLNKRIDGIDTGASTKDLENLRKDVEARPTLDPRDVMVGAGAVSSIGLVPDPGGYVYPTADQPVLHADGTWRHALDGLIRAVPTGKAGTSHAQRVLFAPASLSLTGGVQSSSVLSRTISAGSLSVAGRAYNDPPGAGIKASSDWNKASSGSFTKITAFNTAVEDNDNIVDTVNSKLICRTPGIYQIVINLVGVSAASAGKSLVQLYKNGGPTIGTINVFSEKIQEPNGYLTHNFGAYIRLVTNDYLELYEYSNVGVTPWYAILSIMQMQWIRP